ncbi:hypothetical protein EII12_08880 [Buchananella hordeovulneris]|uniref:asparagine synthase-related protein n=1 Tax=Buchananella hordeovulneris TaxID=52770 RepID=UPI000F5EC4C3|nr:asparagine synthase-related protein [Buchananella hordeovulneris]RRD50862.1 hypothetical protein EII12_08880 [Buchananella hordeovulneris]
MLQVVVDTRAALANGPGEQWGRAQVRRQGDCLELTCDRVRSVPLLWTVRAGRVLVVDDPARLAAYGPFLPDPVGRRQFVAAGFTLGTRTLLADVHQVLAGHTVRIDLRTGRALSVFSPYHRPRAEQFPDDASADAAARAALDAALGSMLARWAGRRLVIPLSGGLDSRLLLAWLRRAGVADVLTFSYGRPGCREMAVSRQVAAAFGYPWHGVELAGAQVTATWADALSAQLVRFAWRGTSLPHVQDWVALRALQAAGLVGVGDVVVPGHTALGSLPPGGLFTAAGPDRTPLARALVAHHLLLDGRARRVWRATDLGGWVRGFLAGQLARDDPDAWAAAWEVCNVVERQAKYIYNSVRTYEFLGLDWDLPLAAAPLWEVAGRLRREQRTGRAWFTALATQFAAAVAPAALPVHRERRLSAAAVARLSRLAAALRVRAWGARVASTHYVLHHPLALDRYWPGARPALAAQLLRGGHHLGLYARAFLTDTWNENVGLCLAGDGPVALG